MALKTTLEDTQDRLEALLTYANGVTGESDTSIGDAIETLANGYGSGGSSSLPQWLNHQIVEIGDNTISNSQAVVDYFRNNYSGFKVAILMDAVTVEAQTVIIGDIGNGIFIRSNNNVLQSRAVGTAYDGYIPKGSRYDVATA